MYVILLPLRSSLVREVSISSEDTGTLVNMLSGNPTALNTFSSPRNA